MVTRRTLSNRQLKSTWNVPPLPSSNKMFSPCRSPRLEVAHCQSKNIECFLNRCTYPRTYPTMDITAHDRVYLRRAANQASGSGNISTNHSWKTGGKLEILVSWKQLRKPRYSLSQKLLGKKRQLGLLLACFVQKDPDIVILSSKHVSKS